MFGAGGKSEAKHVFEPVFGHAGRMGVFGDLDSHAQLWSASEGDKCLNAYLRGTVGYIFANQQVRSYDLTTSGNWSRYLLVKKLGTIGTSTNTIYDGVDNMINIGTLSAKIGNFVNYEVSLMFNMQYNNFDFQLAYEFAGHSKEKHKGFSQTITGNYIVYDPINALDNIRQTAGTAGTAAGESGVNFLPINGNSLTPTAYTIADVTLTTGQADLITNSSLNINSALAPTVYSSSVIGGANYTWRDNDWLPCLGLYGKAEFSNSSNTTANIYMVGIQGNVTF